MNAARLNSAILRIANERDKDSFKLIYDYFSPRLKSYLLKQGSSEVNAEELVQETMVNVWKKSMQFNSNKASATTWIFTIARNLKIDSFRKNKHNLINIDDIQERIDTSPNAEFNTDLIYKNERISKALKSLTPEQHKVIMMSFFEDKSHGEISNELKIPLGTVKSRMRLAFERIRKKIGEKI
jgi:RNA polymerase sigma-70 factor (ECF subfamily)